MNQTLIQQRAIEREIVRRGMAQEKRAAEYKPTRREIESAERLKDRWFDKQRAFFTSEARRRVAFCSRRAGKTLGTAIWFLSSLLEYPTALHLYVAQTSGVAKLYLWPELKRLIHEYDLPFEANENDLTIKHKRGMGALVLKGADNAKQIQNLRGPHWKKVALDEAASFGSYIEELIMEVLGAALRDTNGELVLTGTAGKIKRGLFYEACHELRRRRSDGMPVYELHKWSLQDNPFLTPDAKNEDLIIDDEGFSGVDDPRFLREFRGVWAVGDSERIFAGFTAELNTYEGDLPTGHQWKYALGCDFGWNDESALCVLAWSRTHPCIYVPEIWGKSRQYTDEIAAQLGAMAAVYGKMQYVGDTGGYGKSVVMHLARDYGINVMQAQKREKLDHIAFINSAFARGDIKIHRHGAKRLITQLHEVSWNESRTDAGNHERDDLCLAPETPVMTKRGYIPAEFVGEGDELLTRQGWRPLANSGYASHSPMYKLVFDDGSVLRCTPDHKLFMAGGGETCAKDLKLGDRLFGLANALGTESNGLATLAKVISSAANASCTLKNGSTYADRYMRSGKSIIRTAIRATIALSISKPCPSATIENCTHEDPLPSPSIEPPSTSQKSRLDLHNNDATSGPRSPTSPKTTLASFAQGLLSRGQTALAAFAPFARANATPSSGATAASMISTTSVLSAAHGRAPTDTTSQSAVPSLAIRSLATVSYEPKPRPSVRISVFDVHEYFAGGVFQANCFAMVYGWRFAKNSGAGRSVREQKTEEDDQKRKLLREKLDALKNTEDKRDLGKFAADVDGSARNYRGVSKTWRAALGVR